MYAQPFQPPSDESDDALMKSVADGNTSAFAILLRRHQDRVTRVACRLLGGDVTMAEDVGQETFLRVWRTAATYQPQGTFTAFLLRITRNLCEDTRRRTKGGDVGLTRETTSPSPDSAVVGSALSEAVRCAVAALPEEQRDVFILSHYENLTYREIADILNCPMGTVASRKHHAVHALRYALRDWQEKS